MSDDHQDLSSQPGCGYEERTWQLLRGDLDGNLQEESLRHLRHCAWCRETVETRARDARRGVRAEPLPAAPGLGGMRMFGIGSWFSRGTQRGGGKALLVALPLVIVGLAFFGGGRRTMSGAGLMVEAARTQLQMGNPVVLEPRGDVANVPLALSAWIPAGATQIDLTLRDASGTVVYKSTHVPGKAGVFTAPDTLGVGEGALSVMKVAIPFPDASEFQMAKGAVYGVVVGCGAQASSSCVFRVIPE